MKTKDKPVYTLGTDNVLRPKIPIKPIKCNTGNKVFDTYTNRIVSKGLTITLTVLQFDKLIKRRCRYCNTPNAGGIDRLDSKKGYTHTNSVPCCKVCNMMKYTYSEQLFISHVKKIAAFQSFSID